MRQKAMIFVLGLTMGGALLFTIALVLPPGGQGRDDQGGLPSAARFAESNNEFVASPPNSLYEFAASNSTGSLALEEIVPAVVRVHTLSRAGSGVIIDSTGLVLTSGHLVRDNDKVTVIIGNGEPMVGTVERLNLVADIALVRLPPGEYAWGDLGTESDITLGAALYSVGYPLGMGGNPTVTKGIVSRYFEGPDDRGKFIQTDAAIHLGNSGGPIVNERGQILGIISLIGGGESFTAQSGINFAVSVATIRDRFADP